MRHPAIAIAFAIVTAIAIAACSSPKGGGGLFKSEGCVKCHVFQNNGMGIIDLSDVTTRRSDVWIKDQILRPKSHDPGSGMPSFGHLTDAQVDTIIQYLHTPAQTPK